MVVEKGGSGPLGPPSGSALVPWNANSNAAVAIGSWLSSKNSTHQKIRDHMEKELLRMISHKRRLVANIS